MRSDESRLWLPVSLALSLTALISGIQSYLFFAGVSGLLAAATSIYVIRLDDTETRSERFYSELGLLLVEILLLALLVGNPSVPGWLVTVSLSALVAAETLPGKFRRIFRSRTWLTMGKEVRMMILGVGVASLTLNASLGFYMTFIYAGGCILDSLEIIYRVRTQKA